LGSKIYNVIFLNEDFKEEDILTNSRPSHTKIHIYTLQINNKHQFNIGKLFKLLQFFLFYIKPLETYTISTYPYLTRLLVIYRKEKDILIGLECTPPPLTC